MPWETKGKEVREKIKTVNDLGGIAVISNPRNYLKETKSLIDTTNIERNDVGEKHPYNFMLYELAYKQVPIIFGAVNKTVDFALGPGFYIDTENKAVIKKINKFMEDHNFDVFLRIITRNMLIYGNAFVEIVGKKKSIDKLVVLDSKYMYVKRDNHGKITGYTQYRGKLKPPIPFTKRQIAHFAFNQLGDEAYGTSVLRPLFGSKTVQLLTQFLEMEEAMKVLVQRRANAPMHVKVGSDEFPATATDVEDVADELVDLGSKNELITSHLVDINVLNFRSRLMDIRPYIEHYENSIIYDLEVPAVLMGRANVPEGLANVQMDAFERRIKSLQSFIEKTIEENIFKRIHPNEHVEFEWGQATGELEDQEITKLVNLLKTPLSVQTKIDVENELRKKLGFKEITIKPEDVKPKEQEEQKSDFLKKKENPKPEKKPTE